MTQSLSNTVSDVVEGQAARRSSNAHDEHYRNYLGLIQQGYEHALTQVGAGKLFTTDARDQIWETYLDNLPEDKRQYGNCACCRHFLQRYGTLALITESGQVRSALFNPTYADDDHRAAHAAIDQLISKAKITGVFLSNTAHWGSDNDGAWIHYAISPVPGTLYRYSDKMMRNQQAEYNNGRTPLALTLDRYKLEVLDPVLQIMKLQPFQGAEKAIGQFEWLRNLHLQLKEHPGRREALLWRAVGTAPPGFLNIKDNVGGSFLDDIIDGLSFDHARRKFEAKLDPLKYNRPQVAPTAGNIQRAEDIIAEMGLAKSLERRLARPDELVYIWQPAPVPPEEYDEKTGVFGHLKPKDAKEPVLIDGPTNATVITWDKFRRDVLPQTESMQVHVGLGLLPFAMFTTAVHPDAPPILQWDTVEQRNPVDYYHWHHGHTTGATGSPASQHGLQANSYVTVTGVTLTPMHWRDETAHSHHRIGAAFILADAKETRFNAGLALFPGDLKSELHSVKPTIEAYSNSKSLKDASGEHHAVGLRVPVEPGGYSLLVQVVARGMKLRYKIDRWD